LRALGLEAHGLGLGLATQVLDLAVPGLVLGLAPCGLDSISALFLAVYRNRNSKQKILLKNSCIIL